jgi:hypothetical protein
MRMYLRLPARDLLGDPGAGDEQLVGGEDARGMCLSLLGCPAAGSCWGCSTRTSRVTIKAHPVLAQHPDSRCPSLFSSSTDPYTAILLPGNLPPLVQREVNAMQPTKYSTRDQQERCG